MNTLTKNKTLLQEMALLMQRLGYALNTERTYCDWVAKFIKFNKRPRYFNYPSMLY